MISNKHVGPNKHVGWKFSKIPINVQLRMGFKNSVEPLGWKIKGFKNQKAKMKEWKKYQF